VPHSAWYGVIGAGDPTRLLVRAIDPAQNANGITSTASPAVMDSVTIVRRSRAF